MVKERNDIFAIHFSPNVSFREQKLLHITSGSFENLLVFSSNATDVLEEEKVEFGEANQHFRLYKHGEVFDYFGENYTYPDYVTHTHPNLCRDHSCRTTPTTPCSKSTRTTTTS